VVAQILFFLSSFFLGDRYTHILRKVEGLYIVLDTVHSTPPPIHGPSFSHSVTFSLDRRHTHAHTINYTFYSHSFSLSFTHTLSFFLAHFLVCLLCIILSFFFAPFNHLHSRAFMFVVLIFSNI